MIPRLGLCRSDGGECLGFRFYQCDERKLVAMAGMIRVGQRIAAHAAVRNLPCISALLLGKRNLCSDGRYLPGSNVFVAEGNQEGGQAWPPPTQGGFVAENYPGHAQIPPTQGGFVEQHHGSGDGFVTPVTQGRFVEDFRSPAGQNVDYSAYHTQQQGFAANPYSQGQYGANPPIAPAAYVPQVQLPPGPPHQGQFVSGNPWVSSAQGMYQVAPQVYGMQAQQPPMPDQNGYMYQQQVPPGYAQQSSYQNQYHQQQPIQASGQESYQHLQPPVQAGYQHLQQPIQASGQENYQHLQQPIQGSGQENYQHLQQPIQGSAQESYQHLQQAGWNQQQQDWAAAPLQVPVSQTPVQTSNVQSSEAEAPSSSVVSDGEVLAASENVTSEEISQQQAEEVIEAEAQRESEGSEQVVVAAEEMQTEQTEASEAETPLVNESATETAEAPAQETVSSASAHESEQEAAEEYDATAAAMAEAGVSSEDPVLHHEEDSEEKAKMVESEAEEPVKGLESLLEVETSNKPAPPASQNESFLDILSKTNLNSRQNRPRSTPASFRSQRKTYAKLHNLPRQILKSDLVNYFSEIGLKKENIHINYDEKFYPVSAQVAFDSAEDLKNAQMVLASKGRLGGRVVRVEQFIQYQAPGHAQISDTMRNYLGRMLLMLHIPPECRTEDIERFFDGYGYDPSALSMLDPINMTLARFPKEGNRPVRRAAIGFMSSFEAMRALRERQGDFVLNEPIELRLIQ